MAKRLRPSYAKAVDLGPSPSKVLRLSVRDLRELAACFERAWPKCRAAREIEGLAADIVAIREKRRKGRK